MKRSLLYIALLCAAAPLLVNAAVVNNTRELIKAINTATCGDTVILKAANYVDVQFKVKPICTANTPIKIAAEAPGTVDFIGNTHIVISGNNTSINGIHFKKGTRTKRANLITVSGQQNKIENNKFTDIDSAEGVWIQLSGAQNKVLNNEFSGKRSLASYINVDVSPNTPSSHRVAYNYFSRPLLGSNGGSASRVGHGSMHDFNSRVIFEYNLFEQENGESEIISAKSSENIFRYNTFKNSEGHLSLRQGNRSLVYDNYFIGQGEPKQGGLFVRGEDHVIFNNYFANLAPDPKKTDFGTVSFGSATDKPDPKRSKKGINPYHFPLTKNISFANNTIVNSTSAAIVVGSQFSLQDKRNRTRLPESIYIINNLIVKAPAALIKTQTIVDLIAENNLYTDIETPVLGFKRSNIKIEKNTQGNAFIYPVENNPNTALTPWIEKLALDMNWKENGRLISRMLANKQAGFSVPVDGNGNGNQILPLEKENVGANW